MPARMELNQKISEIDYQLESITKYNPCSNKEKAEKQVCFMRTLHLNESTGRYELVQVERAHQFDTKLPEISHKLLSYGRAVVFLAQHNYTEFNWGEETIIGKPFLALHWFCRVDNKGNAEEFIFRLNGFSQKQAKNFLELFLANKAIDPKLEEENLVSFKEDFDPVGYPQPYLTELAQNIFNSEGSVGTLPLTEKIYREEFIKQISGLSLMRYLTHNPTINTYTLKPRFVLDENGNGCLIAFDRIMERWGRMDSSSTNPQIIHNLQVAQDELYKYYNDPNPLKGDLNINMPTMLSPRTAGLRPGEDKAAAQKLKARPSGDIDLNTNIIPATIIPPELFKEPKISYTPSLPNLVLPPNYPINPIFPRFPFSPLSGGGWTAPPPFPINHNPESTVVSGASSAALGLWALSPLVMDIDNALLTVGLETVTNIRVPQDRENIIDSTITKLPEKPLLPDNIFRPDEPCSAPDTPIFPPTTGFFPEPPKDGGHGGGGGRSLPVENGNDKKSWGVKRTPPLGWKQVSTPGSEAIPPFRRNNQSSNNAEIMYVGHDGRRTQHTSIIEFPKLPKEMVIYAWDLETPPLQVRENKPEGKNSDYHTVHYHSEQEAIRKTEGIKVMDNITANSQQLIEGCHKNMHMHDFVTDGNDGLKGVLEDKPEVEDKPEHKIDDREKIENGEAATSTSIGQQPILLQESLAFWYVLLWGYRNHSLQNFPEKFFLKPLTKSQKSQETSKVTNDTLERDKRNKQSLLLHKRHPKLKLKTSLGKTNISFLALLFLIKLKIAASKITTAVQWQKLLLTDSLLLFLLKPKLFLLRKTSLVHTSS